MKHIYHYNTPAEQRYFLGELRSLYDMIAMNGNIVSHAPAGVAAFLATANKPYYIDPQTHAFQHKTNHLKRNTAKQGEPRNYEFKPSIVNLAKDRLGGPFAGVIDSDRPLQPPDFLLSSGKFNTTVIEQVCVGTTNFQTNTLIESLGEEEREFVEETGDLLPEFIVAPYFYLSPNHYKRWLDITSICYSTTKGLVKDRPVFLCLAISRGALHLGLASLLSTVASLKPDGILLWIDEHEEESLAEHEVRSYIELLSSLKNSTDVVYNKHGGYLSVILGHKEIGPKLDGVAHGINYGESRSIVPIGGGIPMARFYFPSVHSRLRWGDALYIAKGKDWLSTATAYRANVCKCARCVALIKEKGTPDQAFAEYGKSKPVSRRHPSGTIVSLDFPTKEAKQAAAQHYLFNKAHEFELNGSMSLREILDHFSTTYNAISEVTGDDLISHLEVWRGVLEERFPLS